MVLLETGRLRLRAFRDDDLEALGGFYADPAITRHIAAPMDLLTAYRTAARAIAYCKDHSDPSGPGIWAIARREDDRLIGRCGLSAWEDEGRLRWELGYLVGSPFSGQGIATEAAKALRDHARVELGLGALVALVHPENAASLRVLERLGFVPEGDRRVEIDGQPRQVFRSG